MEDVAFGQLHTLARQDAANLDTGSQRRTSLTGGVGQRRRHRPHPTGDEPPCACLTLQPPR